MATGGSVGSPVPVDCGGITGAGFELCDSGPDFCAAVFENSAGCAAVCAAAGLECAEVRENADGACAADTALPKLSCDPASGHTSDYCLCKAGSGGGGASGSGGAGGSSASGGSAGSGGTGGSGGTSGLPQLPDNGCNVRLTDTPVGFASLGGGTVGGGDATPILVTTKEQLENYLGDDEPRVLYLMNDLDFRTAPRNVSVCADDVTCDNGSGVQVDNARVSATCDAGEHVATRTRNESRLDVASNKTLIGIGDGDGAAVRGAGFNVGSSEQVILRNLRIYDINPNLVEAGDGITLEESRHIWLDHLLIEQVSDGYVDIGSGDSNLDDNITISWTRFNGRTAYLCGGKHSYVHFADNAHVTYHHNWFDNGNGRNPKLGHEKTQAHFFNNYWLGIGYFCITAQTDAEARVESNYFENSSRPHWRQLDGNGTAGIAIDDGNVYTGASSGNTNRDVGGTVFSVPYSYTKETAAAARTAITKCAGPQPIR
jgi:pectate lyase